MNVARRLLTDTAPEPMSGKRLLASVATDGKLSWITPVSQDRSTKWPPSQLTTKNNPTNKIINLPV